MLKIRANYNFIAPSLRSNSEVLQLEICKCKGCASP